MPEDARGAKLSVVLVAGSQRSRAQRVVDALAAQSAVSAIELVVVDLASKGTPRLEIPYNLRCVYLPRAHFNRWGDARAEGVRYAHADVVAFVEDHCFPAPDWAEILIETHRGEWAAVGYAFTNADPDSYVTRSSLLARYGAFAHPAESRQAGLVGGNNVSYKRDVLLSFGRELPDLLTIDFNLQEKLKKRGAPMFVESRALAAHEHFTSVAREGITGHHYCRLLAAKRAETQSWGWPRKLLHGVGAPLGSPAIRLWRLFRGLGNRPDLRRDAIRGLPVIIAEYLFDSTGESLGYLVGAGDAEQATLHWELDAQRSGNQ